MTDDPQPEDEARRVLAPALFVGGPADGHVISVQPESVLDPVTLQQRLLMPERHRLCAVTNPLFVEGWITTPVHYQLEVNPAGEGPLWIYRYMEKPD